MDGTASAQAAGAENFDKRWYGAAYPQAKEDVRQGRARDLQDHYERIGRFRGYLPHLRAERPRNPAGVRSAFGGLWTDQGNALDVVDGRLELGQINRKQAELLRAFIRDGYVILRNAVAPWTLARAQHDLERAYAGKVRGQKFSCHPLGFDVGDWQPGVREHPAKALEIHAHSRAIRDLIFCPAISEFLAMIFDRRALASQSLGFYRGSGQGAHQDTAYVTYSLPLQFAASWVALEDVRAGAGELFYLVGSQQLGDFLYHDRYKGVSEGLRLHQGWNPKPEEEAHGQSLVQRSAQLGYREATFLARKGDVLIWAADLAHGGKPISIQETRKSIVTHYCPREVAPLYFEGRPNPRIKRHRSGNAWSTVL